MSKQKQTLMVVIISMLLAFLILPVNASRISVRGVSPLQPPYPPPLDKVNNSLDALSKPTLAMRLDSKLDLPVVTLTIADVQSNFYAQHGSYWHAPSPVAAIPELNHHVNVNAHAAHHNMPSWHELGVNLPTTVDFDIRVDSYTGPRGKGYLIVCQTLVDGVILRRTINYGPETWLGHGWITVTRRIP